MCTGAEIPAAYEAIAAMMAESSAAEGTAAAAGAGAGAGAAGYGAYEAMAAPEIAQALQGITAGEGAGLLGGGESTPAASELWQGLLRNEAAPVSELSSNPAAVTDRSTQAGLLDKARLAFSGGGGSGSASKVAAGMQGLKMMFPDQQGGRPSQAPPMQGQQGPLPSMYSHPSYQARPMANTGPYGTSAGNSLGFTEEQKRKLRELGYQI